MAWYGGRPGVDFYLSLSLGARPQPRRREGVKWKNFSKGRKKASGDRTGMKLIERKRKKDPRRLSTCRRLLGLRWNATWNDAGAGRNLGSDFDPMFDIPLRALEDDVDDEAFL